MIKNYDSKTWMERREDFLDYWSIQLVQPQLEVCEMHETDSTISTKNEIYNYFNRYYNTRVIFPEELIIEFDGKLEENFKAVCGTILNLIKQKIHFAVFYAEKMKSPHIRIYDLLPEDLTSIQKKKACELFCTQIIPFEYFHLLDKHLFGRHKVCLEFSVHWRHETMFKLLFEYLPNQNGTD